MLSEIENKCDHSGLDLHHYGVPAYHPITDGYDALHRLDSPSTADACTQYEEENFLKQHGVPLHIIWDFHCQQRLRRAEENICDNDACGCDTRPDLRHQRDSSVETIILPHLNDRSSRRSVGHTHVKPSESSDVATNRKRNSPTPGAPSPGNAIQREANYIFYDMTQGKDMSVGLCEALGQRLSQYQEQDFIKQKIQKTPLYHDYVDLLRRLQHAGEFGHDPGPMKAHVKVNHGKEGAASANKVRTKRRREDDLGDYDDNIDEALTKVSSRPIKRTRLSDTGAPPKPKMLNTKASFMSEISELADTYFGSSPDAEARQLPQGKVLRNSWLVTSEARAAQPDRPLDSDDDGDTESEPTDVQGEYTPRSSATAHRHHGYRLSSPAHAPLEQRLDKAREKTKSPAHSSMMTKKQFGVSEAMMGRNEAILACLVPKKRKSHKPSRMDRGHGKGSTKVNVANEPPCIKTARRSPNLAVTLPNSWESVEVANSQASTPTLRGDSPGRSPSPYASEASD